MAGHRGWEARTFPTFVTAQTQGGVSLCLGVHHVQLGPGEEEEGEKKEEEGV